MKKKESKKQLKQVTLADLAKVSGGNVTIEGTSEWEESWTLDGPLRRTRGTGLKG